MKHPLQLPQHRYLSLASVWRFVGSFGLHCGPILSARKITSSVTYIIFLVGTFAFFYKVANSASNEWNNVAHQLTLLLVLPVAPLCIVGIAICASIFFLLLPASIVVALAAGFNPFWTLGILALEAEPLPFAEPSSRMGLV